MTPNAPVVLPDGVVALVPMRNAVLFPEATRSAIEFVWLDRADDALRAALTGAPSPRSLELV